jgi:fatty-acyl-CoA synthase
MAEHSTLRDALQMKTVRRLAEMGILDPRRTAGAIASLPWVLGRGPSLGSLAQIHAYSRPHRRAVIDRHGSLTWWELDQRVNRLARALPELGATPGEQVAFVLRNGREFCEAMLAAQKVGVIAAPMNTWGKSRELGALLDRSRPAVFIYDTRHVDQLAGCVPDGIRLLHVGPDEDALDGSESYEDVLAAHSSLPPAPLARDRGSNSIHIHTSGTTGTPKAAERSAGGQGAIALLGLLNAVPYRHDDVMYIPNPMFHALGIGVFSAALGSGATMVLADSFDPVGALQDIEKHRATTASFVPVMIRRMLNLENPPEVDLSSLRVLLVSGSAMPAELRQRTMERFGEVLYDLYGSTEAGWVAIATPESIKAKPDSVGPPALGVQVVILDADGNRLPPGEKGEVHVSSGITFEGYASGEESEMTGDLLSTGDLGFLDEDGYLHIVGRADDMVVVGGENVYPQEIKSVIGEVDGVDEVAVFGIDDEEMGEVLAAFVVGSASEDEVEAACKDALPSYKVPRRIAVVDELPRTSTGKVIRRELAAKLD